MPDSQNDIYWDACVFLSYVNEYPDRIRILEDLLARSGRQFKLYTSTISHVEVAFGASEQRKQALDTEIEQRINALWANPNTVTSVEYHERIARIARDLMRAAISNGWSLKPLDAIHLATAQWLSSLRQAPVEFQTYDRTLVRYARLVDFKIIEPHTPQPSLF